MTRGYKPVVAIGEAKRRAQARGFVLIAVMAIIQALTIQSEHGIHFWDALIVATMREHGISTACSEDRQLAPVPLITVLNPFETEDKSPS
jgi:predicted nucleic acid-binding protein